MTRNLKITQCRQAKTSCRIALLILFGFSAFILTCTVFPEKSKNRPVIELWYGDVQSFGNIGHPQRWVNILGTIHTKDTPVHVSYTLNQGLPTTFSLGRNMTRLARAGDFNLELDRNLLLAGKNRVAISVITNQGKTYFKRMTVKYLPGTVWPLPYRVQWQKEKFLTDAVQVVDGKWRLTSEGIYTENAYYDRIVALGDSTWKDYEVMVDVKFHGFTSPVPEPPVYGVSHAAIALRWPGHDPDQHQPHVKWYPLGATCEFRLFDNTDSCCFRIINDHDLYQEKARVLHSIIMNRWYRMKARVQSRGDTTLYAAKLWVLHGPEPSDWDIVSREGKTDLQKGSALLIAHHTKVTFGNISARPVSAFNPDSISERLSIP